MNTQRGQIFIVILLIFLVVSVIVLAVSSRSITDIKISQTTEESARAFSAAEAGVEEAVELIRSAPIGSDPSGSFSIISGSLPSDATADYTIAPQAGLVDEAFLSPTQLTSDLQTFQIYLADKNNLNSGNYRGMLCFLWGDPGQPPPIPALEASVIYLADPPGPPRDIVSVARFAIDPDAARRAGNNFMVPNGDPFDPTDPDDDSGTCPNTIAASENNLGIDRIFQYTHKFRINGSNLPDIDRCGGGTRCVYMLRMRLLYSSPQYVGVKPANGKTLPKQGFKIESAGKAGETSRKVQVFQSFSSLPIVFDFVLFNGTGTLSK